MTDSDTDSQDELDTIAAALGTVDVSDGRLDPECRDEPGEAFGYDG